MPFSYSFYHQKDSSNIVSGLEMKGLKDTDSLTGGMRRKDQSQEWGQKYV